MCNKINVKFAWYGKPDKRKLKVVATYVGESNGKPISIGSFGEGELLEPDEKFWIKKRGMANQRFKKNAPHAEENNAILSAINLNCENALAHNPETLEDFFAIALPSKNAGKHQSQSFGGFIESYINELKEGVAGKCPSANHQIFTTLLHHLEREDKRPHSKHIIAKRTNAICNADFKAFGEYLCSLNQPNYNDVMAYFKRVQKVAVSRGFSQEELKYNYKEHQPTVNIAKKITQRGNEKATLTPGQVKAFESLDVSKIKLSGVNPGFHKQLYKDTALLMYYLFSRPVDTISLKYSDIMETSEGHKYIDYVPSKKSNDTKAQAKHTKCPICKEAMAIIERYKGMSKGGYLLPFSENEKSWSNIYVDAKEYHQRYIKCNHILGRVNKFLKKVAIELGVCFRNDTFSLYVMRHSAITHAINRGNNILTIAQVAGTSVKQIEETYYDHTQDMINLI